MTPEKAVEILKVRSKYVAEINIDAILAYKMAIQALEKQKDAKQTLKEACKIIEGSTGSCPWEMFDYYMDCGNVCGGKKIHQCWYTYFLQTVKE